MKPQFTLKPLPIACLVIILILTVYGLTFFSIDKESVDKRIKHYISQNFPGSTFSFENSNYFLSNRINYQINNLKIKTLENYEIESKSVKISFSLSAVLGGRRAKLFAKDVTVRFKSSRDFYQVFENRTAFSKLKVHKILRNNEVGLNAQNISLELEDTQNNYFFKKIYLRNINQDNYTAAEMIFRVKSNSYIKLNGEVNLVKFFKNLPALDGTLSFLGFEKKYIFFNNLKLKVHPSKVQSNSLFKAKGKSNVWDGEFDLNLRDYELRLFNFNMKVNKNIFLEKEIISEFEDCKEKKIEITGEARYLLTEKKIIPKVKFSNNCYKGSVEDFGELVRWNVASESKRIKFYEKDFADEDFVKKEIFLTTRENVLDTQSSFSKEMKKFIEKYIISAMLHKISFSDKEELYLQEGIVKVNEEEIEFQELKIMKENEKIEIEIKTEDLIKKFHLIEFEGEEKFEKI